MARERVSGAGRGAACGDGGGATVATAQHTLLERFWRGNDARDAGIEGGVVAAVLFHQDRRVPQRAWEGGRGA